MDRRRHCMGHGDPVAEHAGVGDREGHARACLAQEEVRRAPRAAQHVDEADGRSFRPIVPCGVSRQLLHEALGAPVVARRLRRLVRRGDHHGVDRVALCGPQHVPAPMQIGVEELVGVDLGPVDVFVRREVENEVRTGAADLGGHPALVADVAEHVLDADELERVA